jgi:hypothetical protein
MILGFALVSAFVSPSTGQSVLKTGTAPARSSANLMCSEGKIICVPQSVAYSLISNPLRIEVHVNSPDEIEVDWEIDDSSGQVLESSSTYDYPDMPTRDSSPTKTLSIQDFIFTPAKSESGTLILGPSRYTIAGGKTDLPGLKIPVRLTTGKTLLTTLEPENPQALGTAVIEWMEGGEHAEFDPKMKLVPHHDTIMRVDHDALIGATAEAVLRSGDGGQSPWHVTDWHQEGSTAHVKIAGDGWAGVTYYLTEVDYLIRKSVLALPGIKTFVFDPRQ